ncbi:enoyl-CoA hydratase/isomerase family protein [Pelomicrobium sp. G1]|uniref:enoyl-CoA hydratase/isomerase family protein n=1 Tax=unclassified Pelomicrobium TaxID=2815318 RepID=UPI003F764F2B
MNPGEPLLIARTEGVARLTLHRPHKANALDGALVEALIAAVEAAAGDGTRLLILDGSGEHFCAGFDFSDFESQTEGDLALRFLRIETLLQAIYHAPFQTLALAHGRNFGAGADLVVACSRRIASPEATFRMPGLRFGVVLGTRRLAHRVGPEEARRLLIESRTFGADEAMDTGFLSRIAARDEWEDLIAEAAREARALPLESAARLNALTVTESRDADMAELARSVGRPGLKARLRAFRAEG